MPNPTLILIDIQNDYFPEFIGARKPLPNMRDAAENATRLLEHARRSDWTIVHVRHVAASDSAPLLRPGTAGSEIHTSVQPMDGETIIQKQRPNSFVSTDLETFLQHNASLDLVLCGAMSQMCVDATARAAVDLGFKVSVVHDACAASPVSHAGVDVTADLVHAAIMAPLAASYARVVPTQDIAA